MNEPIRVSRYLLLLAALAVWGCADEVTEPQSVADAPQPDTTAPQAVQPGSDAPEAEQPGTGPPETIQPSAPDPETSTPSTEPAEAVVGAQAPDFVATGLDGEPASLSDFLGEQHVVLAFSRAHW